MPTMRFCNQWIEFLTVSHPNNSFAIFATCKLFSLMDNGAIGSSILEILIINHSYTILVTKYFHSFKKLFKEITTKLNMVDTTNWLKDTNTLDPSKQLFWNLKSLFMYNVWTCFGYMMLDFVTQMDRDWHIRTQMSHLDTSDNDN